ncbi:MAG TPA: aminopeptidase P N-terminal domain-containing protein [Planctomycetota bacterium]|nr:aminopeptidase P N-terminal domain-containing protein [Planctomycetota bacterium]
MPDTRPYRENRERLQARLAQAGAAALVPTARARLRNADTEYPFRPDSDFWYLTGFGEPEGTLLLLPPRAGARRGESVLFLRERVPSEETWTGRRLGVERACETLGVDHAFPARELWTRLGELLDGCERLVYRSGLDEERDRRLLALLAERRARSRGGEQPPTALLDPAAFLGEARLLKWPLELERMRRAAAITGEAHRAVMGAARPGMREYELDALLAYTFRRRGADGEAYPNIVATGANACVLHYRAADAELRAGELVLVDAGCEFEHYASDVTRTFPVDGHFTGEGRALYEVVLAAQQAVLAAVRPGTTLDALHGLALERLVEGALALGLLAGDATEVLAAKRYRHLYMHRTSHWLGLDVHDCGAYAVDGAPRALEPGMVLTVEPGIYIAPDEESVEARWRGSGVRIEDDVLVTPAGAEVLTADVPKTIAEVEAACAAGR